VESGELKLMNAAVILGLSYRQTKRLGQRYREEGVEGLKRPTLAAEHLASDDHLAMNAQTLRHWMLDAGLWSAARKAPTAPQAAGAERACRRLGADGWKLSRLVLGTRPASRCANGRMGAYRFAIAAGRWPGRRSRPLFQLAPSTQWKPHQEDKNRPRPRRITLAAGLSQDALLEQTRDAAGARHQCGRAFRFALTGAVPGTATLMALCSLGERRYTTTKGHF